MLEKVFSSLLEPFGSILDQHDILSYIAAIFFVIGSVIVSRLARRKKKFNIIAVFRLITKKTVWLHRSAKLDYKMYVVNLVLMVFFLGYFTYGLNFWAELFGSWFS